MSRGIDTFCNLRLCATGSRFWANRSVGRNLTHAASLIISWSIGTQPKTSLVSKANCRPSFGTGPRVAVHCPLVLRGDVSEEDSEEMEENEGRGNGIPQYRHDHRVSCCCCYHCAEWKGRVDRNKMRGPREREGGRYERERSQWWEQNNTTKSWSGNTCVYKQGLCLSSAYKWANVKHHFTRNYVKNIIYII